MADVTTVPAAQATIRPSPRRQTYVQEPGAGSIAGWFVAFAVTNVILLYLMFRTDGWGAAWGLTPAWSVVIGVLFSLVMVWLWLRVAFRRGATSPIAKGAVTVVSPQEYLAHGLGPVNGAGGPNGLYLDMVKRAVSNILYQDDPLIFYDHSQSPLLASGFDLSRRAMGEDAPTEAQTMIGLRRLDNISLCVERVLADNVPGDLVEAGVFRGGAAVFMRAALKAHGVTDRRVFACDTFTPISPKRPNWFLTPIAQGLGAIPSKRWRRWLFLFLQNHLSDATSFPPCEDPAEDMIEFVMWYLRNPAAIPTAGGASLPEVQSLFARYGLLDDQVVFVQGFFADAIPKAPLDRASVIRLDGDTYESTRDAISLLYPKLSPGGFCIIDDYHAYADCRRAVDEYRNEHVITDEIIRIDNLAVYWRRSFD